MCWLKRREKDVKIVGQDHLLKNLHTIGLFLHNVDVAPVWQC